MKDSFLYPLWGILCALNLIVFFFAMGFPMTLGNLLLMFAALFGIFGYGLLLASPPDKEVKLVRFSYILYLFYVLDSCVIAVG